MKKHLLPFLKTLLFRTLFFLIIGVIAAFAFFFLFDTSFKADFYTQRSVKFFQESNFDQAVKYQKKALKINRKQGRKEAIARNYSFLGLIYLQTARNEGKDGSYNDHLLKAEEYMLKALNLFETTEEWRPQAEIHRSMAMAYSYFRNDLMAMQHLKKMIPLIEKNGNQWMLLPVYLELGQLYEKAGMIKKACSAWKKGRNVEIKSLKEDDETIYHDYRLMKERLQKHLDNKPCQVNNNGND